MASLGHVAVGIAAGRVHGDRGPRLALAMTAFSILSLLPDLDVVAFFFRIPYSDPFGHRGASHSFLVALALGAMLLTIPSRQRVRTAVIGGLVAASHGLLDTLTDGGLGVALLWPFTDARYFAPWRPIPVAPIGSGMFSERGLYVIAVETLLFAPLLAYGLWPRRRAE
jgi:inner membrane protein